MPRTNDRTSRRRSQIRAAVGAALMVLGFAHPGAVQAHAELESSTPADGAILAEPPTEVVLTFSEAVVGDSSFTVLDASGATIATGAPDPAADTTMRADLPILTPGAFTIQWTSVAGDGDILRGTLAFTVAEPTPTPPTASPTASLTAAPPSPSAETPTQAPPAASPTPADGGSSGGGADALIPIAIVAIVVAAGLAMLLRRRAA